MADTTPRSRRPRRRFDDDFKALAVRLVLDEGMRDVLTAPRSPWQNAYVDRFIGSVRRECLDDVIVLTVDGLRRVLRASIAYYEQSRTHLSLNKDAPIPRPIAAPGDGRVAASAAHHFDGDRR